MLTVVEHHEHPTVGDETGEGVHRGAARLIGQAQRAGDRDRHHTGMGDRRKVHVPHTVTELRRDARRDLNGETGLAGAAGTGQRHQPVVGQQLLHVSHLCAAAHETGELHRKMVGDNGRGYPQRRELVYKVGMAQLRHPFGVGQIAQPMGAQIGQPRVWREPLGDQFLGRAGEHGLPAMGEIAQPGGAVDRRADVVAFVAQLDLAGMQPDAQPDRGQRGPLQLQRTGHCVGRAGERGHEAVALTLLHRPHAAVAGDDFGDRLVEACEGGGHLLGLGLPQPRGTLDVCQKQRHRSLRQQPAHDQLTPVHQQRVHRWINLADAKPHPSTTSRKTPALTGTSQPRRAIFPRADEAGGASPTIPRRSCEGEPKPNRLWIAHLRDVLGDQTYESLARKGETMTTAEMVTYAYDQIDQARTELEHPS